MEPVPVRTIVGATTSAKEPLRRRKFALWCLSSSTLPSAPESSASGSALLSSAPAMRRYELESTPRSCGASAVPESEAARFADNSGSGFASVGRGDAELSTAPPAVKGLRFWKKPSLRLASSRRSPAARSVSTGAMLPA